LIHVILYAAISKATTLVMKSLMPLGYTTPSLNRIYFTDEDPRFNTHIRLLGVACREIMPAGFVSRRLGLPAFLCVLFHDKVSVEVMSERIEVLPGTVILWDEKRPHYFGNVSQPWDHSWVVFSGDDLEQDWMRAAFERPQRFQDASHLLGCFSRLLREFQAFEKPDLLALSANIHLLLRELCRGYNVTNHSADVWDPVRRARHWITGNLRQKLPVAVVAKRVSLSPSRLQQLFRAQLNCSVQQYIERERLQEARYWLMHEGMRISAIAEQTGFSNAFYFTRRFTKAFHQSPREYRRLQQIGSGKTNASAQKS
jgi:AraC-like DNA-binding protein